MDLTISSNFIDLSDNELHEVDGGVNFGQVLGVAMCVVAVAAVVVPLVVNPVVTTAALKAGAWKAPAVMFAAGVGVYLSS